MRNKLFFCLFIAGIVMMAVGCDGPKGDIQKATGVAPVDSDSITYDMLTHLDTLFSDKEYMKNIDNLFEELKQFHVDKDIDSIEYKQLEKKFDLLMEKFEKLDLPLFDEDKDEKLLKEKHSTRLKLLEYEYTWWSEMTRIENESAAAGFEEPMEGNEEFEKLINEEYRKELWRETH